jgi:FkbM family methyltransferase
VIDVTRSLRLLGSGSSRARRIAVVAYNAARWPLVKLGDPIVRYEMAGRMLRVPISHDLPVIRLLFPEYGVPFRKLVRLTIQKYPRKAMVDVGANVGDTAAIMLAEGVHKVLAIEPSAKFRRLLTQNAPEVTVSPALLGPPGYALIDERHGSGRAVPGTGVATQLLSDVAEDDFSAPSLVKLDTDGMDQAILLADLEWLSDSLPVLFVEFSPDLIPEQRDGARFFPALRDAGYRHIVVFDERGRYLVSVAPGDERIVEDVFTHFVGGGNRHYADLAMFPERDADIWMDLRSSFVQHSVPPSAADQGLIG